MYFRVSVIGSMPSGEVWSVNPCYHFNLAIAPTWDQESGDDIVAALLTAITSTTVPTALRELMSSSCFITGIRLEGRNEDESLLGVSEGVFPAPIMGLQGLNKPFQTAVVGSLRTNTPGAKGRGRIYWPAMFADLSSTTGRIVDPTTTELANGFVALLSLIGDTIQANAGLFPFTDVLLAVRSTTDHVSRTVTRIQVGDVLDTQRRRRDDVRENYVSVDM